ncbi:hypothetical protein K440DRAFT_622267 [Wilcoxina mikolae CBS 423.85]|nr:hypothetical protein K440DRAFT_622267 [Wilcoxina mikolae CBS 423.85]
MIPPVPGDRKSHQPRKTIKYLVHGPKLSTKREDTNRLSSLHMRLDGSIEPE